MLHGQENIKFLNSVRIVQFITCLRNHLYCLGCSVLQANTGIVP